MKTKSTTFYGKAQRSKTLDLRDIRGKIHDMPLILTEFILALLCMVQPPLNRTKFIKKIRDFFNLPKLFFSHYAGLVPIFFFFKKPLQG